MLFSSSTIKTRATGEPLSGGQVMYLFQYYIWAKMYQYSAEIMKKMRFYFCGESHF
jgi:hypothetical protein